MVNGQSNSALALNGHASNGAAGTFWIALDAMGSDHGPHMTVAGALTGIREHGLNVILVGDEATLQAEVKKANATALLGSRLKIKHASENVAMDDKPAAVVRKRDTSMRVALELAKSGEARAAVSAGNSGAYMGTALLVFGRIKGVLRPAIGTLIPAPHKGTHALLLDSGANTAVAPGHLVQWAFLGDAYARIMQGKARPRVAVLSNGEEDSKGTDLTRAANESLKQASSALHYVGYCEGRDLMHDVVDVVITDGFTGNVVLKTVEGIGKAIKEGLEGRFKRNILSRLQYLAVHNIMQELAVSTDYRRAGGAPLLGVNGVAIVAHGKSDAMALGYALKVAHNHVTLGLNDAIAKSLAAHDALFPDAKEKVRQFQEKGALGSHAGEAV